MPDTQHEIVVGAPPPPEQCNSCKFTVILPNGRRVCRRGPPGPQPPDSQSGLAFVPDDWWCGEYKRNL